MKQKPIVLFNNCLIKKGFVMVFGIYALAYIIKMVKIERKYAISWQ